MAGPGGEVRGRDMGWTWGGCGAKQGGGRVIVNRF